MQHVAVPTHISGHTLDLLVTTDEDSILSSRPSVKSLCFSDHHLVSCQLRLNRDLPVPVTYTYRPLRRMDMESFRRDLFASSLFLDDENITADDYADLINAEVTRVLDIHAPLRTMKKRQGKHDDGWSDGTERRVVRRTSRSTLKPPKRPRL